MAFDFTSLVPAGSPPPAVKWKPPGKYNFTFGNNDPDGLEIEDLKAAVQTALSREGRRLSDYRLHMGPQGYKPLREFLVKKLKRDAAIACSADDIVLTSGSLQGLDTGDPRAFTRYEDVWQAFLAQLDAMVARTVSRVVETVDERGTIAPVPLLSALIDGAIETRRDMTAGGARYRTFGMLAEGAAHAIDSLAALRQVVFTEGRATMAEVCDALDADFDGYEGLRARLLTAPKYGNDDEGADAVGREVIEVFTSLVARHGEAHRSVIRFPCGVGTFSWYIGIGEGLGPSPDGRPAGEPVSSNFSPALGRDLEGLPAAILSYGKMRHEALPAGGPLDLRLAGRLVEGDEGTERMAGLVRGFVETGGSMMTLTVADTEDLRAAQRDPERYRSLRVRMGGWCAYFTMLSREQQEHQIRRQEGRS